MLTNEQIRLMRWMYNFCILEMAAHSDSYLESDQVRLQEAVFRRFPEYANEIVKEFK